VILEALSRRIAQTFHAPGNQGIDIAFAVVSVLGQIAQKCRIGTAGLQQLAWHGVHLVEPVVAKDDVEIIIRIDQRARHVVEGDLELPL
jgi:hypothetical protein